MRLFVITSILFLAVPMLTNAQQSETLFTADVRHGGFGATQFGVTSVNNEAAYLRGSRGAWVIGFNNGHALNIGLGSYRTANDFESATEINGESYDMSTNYGGFELEYLYRSNRLVHAGVQTTIGAGTVRLKDFDTEIGKSSDRYFLFQPGVNANLNITRWFRVSGGVYYRYTSGVNLAGTSDSDLSGASAILALRFGRF